MGYSLLTQPICLAQSLRASVPNNLHLIPPPIACCKLQAKPCSRALAQPCMRLHTLGACRPVLHVSGDLDGQARFSKLAVPALDAAVAAFKLGPRCAPLPGGFRITLPVTFCHDSVTLGDKSAHGTEIWGIETSTFVYSGVCSLLRVAKPCCRNRPYPPSKTKRQSSAAGSCVQARSGIQAGGVPAGGQPRAAQQRRAAGGRPGARPGRCGRRAGRCSHHWQLRRGAHEPRSVRGCPHNPALLRVCDVHAWLAEVGTLWYCAIAKFLKCFGNMQETQGAPQVTATSFGAYESWLVQLLLYRCDYLGVVCVLVCLGTVKFAALCQTPQFRPPGGTTCPCLCSTGLPTSGRLTKL